MKSSVLHLWQQRAVFIDRFLTYKWICLFSIIFFPAIFLVFSSFELSTSVTIVIDLFLLAFLSMQLVLWRGTRRNALLAEKIIAETEAALLQASLTYEKTANETDDTIRIDDLLAAIHDLRETQSSHKD